MKAIILCAGMGTRLGNMTETKPKCLISFKNKTLLEHSIDTRKKPIKTFKFPLMMPDFGSDSNDS